MIAYIVPYHSLYTTHI